jgi:WD40 repeat protein
MWNVNDGTCIKSMTEHRGAVTFIVELDGDRFCSGGTDAQLCFWNFSGDLLATVKRQEEESRIH